ncbi:MAG TPA: hypothetical protein P5529_04030 [Saccharofermentans sp.]|nr:hypothetical protein [Saccharofermentans sp.]
MAGKSELQKSLSFRLNLSKEDERELYEAIMGHNRDNANDSYGSSGAYIKAALKCYHGNEMLMEQQEHFKEEMQMYLQMQANEQRELFLKALEVHDQKMVAMIVESVASTLARMEFQPSGKRYREENNTSSLEKVQRKSVDILQDTMDETIDETMPEEAFSYLQNL